MARFCKPCERCDYHSGTVGEKEKVLCETCNGSGIVVTVKGEQLEEFLRIFYGLEPLKTPPMTDAAKNLAGQDAFVSPLECYRTD